MLSDAERRRLAEIETQLRTDDPDFVQGFDDPGRRGRRTGQRHLTAAFAALSAVLLCGLGLGYGNVGTLVLALAAVGATVRLWVMRRRTP